MAPKVHDQGLAHCWRRIRGAAAHACRHRSRDVGLARGTAGRFRRGQFATFELVRRYKTNRQRGHQRGNGRDARCQDDFDLR